MVSSITVFIVLVLTISLNVSPSESAFTRRAFMRSKRLLRSLVKASVMEHATMRNITKTSRVLLKDIKRQRSCNVDVCFALQGDKTITAPTYDLEKVFVQLSGAIVGSDDDASTAAVQYATSTVAIQPNIQDRVEFVKSVGKSEYSGMNKINIGSGLAYCWSQVRRSKNSHKAVILLGSGTTTLGFAPKIVVDVMKREGADIMGVLTSGTKKSYVSEVGISSEDVVELYDYNQMGVALRKVLSNLCSIKYD